MTPRVNDGPRGSNDSFARASAIVATLSKWGFVVIESAQPAHRLGYDPRTTFTIDLEHMTTHARGTFVVKLDPQAPAAGDDTNLGRLTIEKQFSGDLEGASRGQMLSAGTADQGSAGYVALERVSGTLGGRKGSFVLQHYGVMSRGDGQLTVTVVPDSGTDELTGLTGRFGITIVDKKHLYDFEYELAG